MTRSVLHAATWLALGLASMVAVAACSVDSEDGTSTVSRERGEAESTLGTRLQLIDEAVEAWGQAGTIEDAHEQAEAAANLIVGPNGPGYGDRNGDGEIGGSTIEGLLPGIDGTPPGLALESPSNPCIERDVLGGSWEDPEAEWGAMTAAIAAWEPDNNTMPTLPSHPMRVVGWATFTIDTDSLARASGFASHARLHSSLSLRALDC